MSDIYLIRVLNQNSGLTLNGASAEGGGGVVLYVS